jgi:hypothetical protein
MLFIPLSPALLAEKFDIFRIVFKDWQLGHCHEVAPKGQSSSNSQPHPWHLNSYKGIYLTFYA